MIRHYNAITVGSTTLDAFMTIDHESVSCRLHADTGELCFRHGDKVDVKEYIFQMGGNATNVAVGLSRLGVKATLVSEIGDDEFSIKIRNSLAREHIDRLFVTEKQNSATSFSVIMNVKGERTIFVQDVQRDHNFHLVDVTCDYLYLTSMGRIWQEPYKHMVDFAQKHKAKIVFNPGSRQLHEGRETLMYVIKHSDILVVNKEEGESILGRDINDNSSNEHRYIRELLTDLTKIGPETVLITNGVHGAFVLSGKDEYAYQEIFKGEVVERTGAGDAFASGFLSATIHNLPLQTAMLWGAVNSSSVIAQVGAEKGLLTRNELESLAT